MKLSCSQIFNVNNFRHFKKYYYANTTAESLKARNVFFQHLSLHGQLKFHAHVKSFLTSGPGQMSNRDKIDHFSGTT